MTIRNGSFIAYYLGFGRVRIPWLDTLAKPWAKPHTGSGQRGSVVVHNGLTL